MEVLTTNKVYCLDPSIDPPPKNKQVWCVSKYGVGRKDIFNPEFDIAWYPLPRLTPELKKKLNGNNLK